MTIDVLNDHPRTAANLTSIRECARRSRSQLNGRDNDLYDSKHSELGGYTGLGTSIYNDARLRKTFVSNPTATT